MESVDGTLIQAWANHKSFKPRDPGDQPPSGPGRNAEADWKGKPRSNETHQSTTDPQAKLIRKSQGSPAMLAYQGPHGEPLCHGGRRSGHAAQGRNERVAALAMLDAVPASRPRTVCEDKAYDTYHFVQTCRERRE